MPAISTMSLGAGLADRARDRGGAVALHDDARRGVAKPARMSATIASPSSPRGLSSVTITRSAWRSAIAAICGRLPRSRSPPQPNTQIRRAWRVRAQRGQRLLQRIGRVRVVDDHQRLRAVAAERGSCGRGSAAAATASPRSAPARQPSARSVPATASRLSTLKRPEQRRAHRDGARAVVDQVEARCRRLSSAQRCRRAASRRAAPRELTPMRAHVRRQRRRYSCAAVSRRRG